MIKRSTGVMYDINSKQVRWLNNGRHCVMCGLPKSEWKRRTDWRCCSVKCTKKLYDKTTYWQDLRIKIFKRDGWKCVKCDKIDKEKSGFFFVADHIIPISIGGDEWDIDNIQTLCIRCNKIKTARDHKDIAKQRRIEKKQKGNTTLSNGDKKDEI